jgi:hypothetical protein
MYINGTLRLEVKSQLIDLSIDDRIVLSVQFFALRFSVLGETTVADPQFSVLPDLQSRRGDVISNS